MKKFSFLLAFLLLTSPFAFSQKIVDDIVGVVGGEVILRSEIEAELLQLQVPDTAVDRAKCMLLDQALQKRLLLSRAKIDSLKISDDQVNNELERRVNFFISQPSLGSVEALEKYYGKSLVEIKNDFRETIKDQLLADQMRDKVLTGVDVTPIEIRKFYADLPKDSLPYYNTELEIGQIVIFPKVSSEEKKEAIEKLRAIRNEILAGAKFSTKAIVFSEDNGSAVKGGDLGMQPSSNFVTEFSAAARLLPKDSISDIVETKFGYHIIKMIERKGDNIHVAHILIRPKLTEKSIEATRNLLDSIRKDILTDSITFQNAAYRYSEDEETKNRGGLMVDLKTNSSHIPVDELDATVFLTVDKLKVGEVSEPVYFKTEDGKDAYRLLYLKSKTPPHKANLGDDYPKIKDFALQYKKQQVLNDWIKKYIPQTYIRYDHSYVKNCADLNKWENGIQAYGSK